MRLSRVLRHLLLPDWWRSVIHAPTWRRSAPRSQPASRTHRGELRFVVEGPLPLASLWQDSTSRRRAIELFASQRVWDTEENSGILIYVQLVDRRVEILADRGIAARVAQAEWDAICRAMEASFRKGEWRQGALQAVARAGELLARHFPARQSNPNELPDQPLVL
jgi:uncharacterized membrane protein